MESGMRAQFYMVGALMIMMYIIFVSRVFTSLQTEAKLPEIRSPTNIFDVFQEIANEGGDTYSGAENFLKASQLSEESFSVSCDPFASIYSTCLLEEAHWMCGVNVTVTYGSRSGVTLTRFIQKDNNFMVNSSRIPLFFRGNTSANMRRISITLSGFEVPPLISYRNSLIGTSCSGNTCEFKVNVRETPQVAYIYNASGRNYRLYRDIGVLNDTGYDASSLINVLQKYYQFDVLELDDLGEIQRMRGPALLFLSEPYPQQYLNSLLDYVEQGGILVSPYGLCRTSSMSCAVGEIVEESSSLRLTNSSGFNVNVSSSTSKFFTRADLPWAVNGSLAAIGAIHYGEGWIVFVGNESFLRDWDRLEDLVNFTVKWALPSVEITTVECPVQKP